MRRKASPSWPFWLLIAAWVCANTPPALTCDALAWMKEAAHFSHQDRLKADVALILAGKEAAPLFAFIRSAPPVKPVLPHVPPETLARKADLNFQATDWPAPPGLRERRGIESSERAPATGRAKPPHEPPRTRMMA
jgi:hypothetical protein